MYWPVAPETVDGRYIAGSHVEMMPAMPDLLVILHYVCKRPEPGDSVATFVGMANYIGNKFGKEDHDKLVLPLSIADRSRQ